MSYLISGAVHAAAIGVLLALISPLGIALAFVGGVLVLTALLLIVAWWPRSDQPSAAADAADAGPDATAPLPVQEPVAKPIADVAETTPEPRPAPKPTARPAIPDYEDLTVARILPLLPGLTKEQLAWVLSIESANGSRVTVLQRVEKLLANGNGNGNHKNGAAPKPAAQKPAAQQPAQKPVAKKATTPARKRTPARVPAGRK